MSLVVFEDLIDVDVLLLLDVHKHLIDRILDDYLGERRFFLLADTAIQWLA